MIENGLFLTGSDAELLSHALSEMRAKSLFFHKTILLVHAYFLYLF
jgi:hypothetical protein